MKKASVTVEAAFVIPIIIWIVCTCLYQALIYSDRIIIEMTADRVLEEFIATKQKCDDTNMDVSHISDRLSEMLLVHSVNGMELINNKKYMEINVVASTWIESRFLMSDEEFVVKRKVSNESFCSKIRRIDIVKNSS